MFVSNASTIIGKGLKDCNILGVTASTILRRPSLALMSKSRFAEGGAAHACAHLNKIPRPTHKDKTLTEIHEVC